MLGGCLKSEQAHLHGGLASFNIPRPHIWASTPTCGSCRARSSLASVLAKISAPSTATWGTSFVVHARWGRNEDTHCASAYPWLHN